MTRSRNRRGTWDAGPNRRWMQKSIPLSELLEGEPREDEAPPALADAEPASFSSGPLRQGVSHSIQSSTSAAAANLERLDSVIHDFLSCLNQASSHAPVDGTGSANAARFRQILEATPPKGSPLLGPPVLCGMSPPIGLESLFGFLGSLRKTGVLRIHADGATYMISVVRGDVVHAVSHPRPNDELLGNLLIARGAIDRDALDHFFERCGPYAGLIGEALNREELVSMDELRIALEIQLQHLFDRLLAAHSSEWCFHEGEATLSFINLRVNATTVLLESARKRDEIAGRSDVLYG